MSADGSQQENSLRAEPTLRISVIVDAEAFEQLPVDQWDALVEALSRPTPYLLHGWLAPRLQNASESNPQIHLAWRDARLVGALPLEVRRRRGLRVCGCAAGPLAAWPDILLDAEEPEETARRLIESARESNHDICHFHGLAESSRLAAFSRLRLVKTDEHSTFDFESGWKIAYRDRISKRHRQDHRRKRRLLAELGHLETRVARTRDELDAVLEHTFHLHQLRWSQRYDASGYADPESRRAMKDVVARLSSRGAYRIVTLELDGKPIAFLSFFVLGRTAFGHRTGFDPAFAAHSPGLLVFFDGFAACEADGMTRFEFGGGDERFKRQLADAVEPVYDGIGLATGVRGALASAAWPRFLAVGERMKESSRIRTTYRRVRDRVRAAP